MKIKNLVVVWTSWNNNNNKITLPRSIFWYDIKQQQNVLAQLRMLWKCKKEISITFLQLFRI